MKRVLEIPDIHLYYKDGSTLKGTKRVAEKLIMDITDIVVSYQVDTIILGGDVFHAGYDKNIAAFHSHYNLLSRLSSASKGKNYLCCGNHALIGKSTNPEVYINQPGNLSKYSPSDVVFSPVEPLFESPGWFELENVIFSLHHYDDLNKEYRIDERITAGKKHIGIYHDLNMLPYEAVNGYVPNASMCTRILKGVDYAIVNHVHQVRDTFAYNDTKITVPGSLIPTSNEDKYFDNEYVSLPLFEVDNGSVIQKSIKLNRRLNEIERVDKKEDKLTRKKRPGLSLDPSDVNSVCSYASLNEYSLRMGTDKEVLRVIQMAYTNKLSKVELASLYDTLNKKGGRDSEVTSIDDIVNLEL